MRRAIHHLPVYTGDVSGACSALFELGGMVVIHDPSGCNSTYNTHDETRWYDHDSLIFITGLTERQAILGSDDKLVNDVCDAAERLEPRFIALVNSPIPFIAGTDFPALCALIERRCNRACLYVPTNGMHDYVVGAGGALAEIARRFVGPAAMKPGTANLLGITPLDFACGPTPDELARFVADAGFKPLGSWAQGSDLDTLAQAAAAEVNLVVSATGLPCARILHERFGTPYVVGVPEGAFAGPLAVALAEAARTKVPRFASRDLRGAASTNEVCVVGEPVRAQSVACALERTEGVIARVISTVEADPALLAAQDVTADGEEDVAGALSAARLVYADPLYAPALPAGARLIGRPHFAFSGRAALALARAHQDGRCPMAPVHPSNMIG